MKQSKDEITVYYDGACPKCVRDRQNYEKISGKAGEDVCWFDITDREDELRALGIDPRKALTELHVKDGNDQILSEMDAYIALMDRVPVLRPLSWLVHLPLLRPLIADVYHWSVQRRLARSGRL